MTSLLVGDYDAATFVEGNFATYPQLPAGVTLYQPTMHWRVTVAGTVHGQAVVPNDLLFATQGGGRLFGDALFGDEIFGGISDGAWTVERVFFLKWDSTAAPPDMVPYPNAGLPFTRDGDPEQPDGNWAPGWRVVIDAYYNDAVGSRTYGDRLYGHHVFGDANDAGGLRWVDITPPGFRVEIGDGTQLGAQRVPVAEVVLDLVDDDGVWFDFAEPATWYRPQPGTPIRVGLIDPLYAYHPRFVGEIERIEDIHDADLERVVTIRGFGRVMDLTVDFAGITYNSELASTRFKNLASLAGWSWDAGNVLFPTSGDQVLLAEVVPREIVARDEMDRAVQSVGWFFDSDRNGRMRVRQWPHVPTGDPIVVTDIAGMIDSVLSGGDAIDYLESTGDPWFVEDPPGSGLFEVTSGTLVEDPPHTDLFDILISTGVDADALVSASITFADDQSALLNKVMTTNTANASVELSEEFSRGIYGRRGRALDYPKTGLSWSDPVATEVWVRRVLNRFAWILRHCEVVEADTFVDQRWLPVLAELDTGRALTVERRGIRPYTLENVVVGWREVIVPGRWISQLFTSTTTTSQ